MKLDNAIVTAALAIGVYQMFESYKNREKLTRKLDVHFARCPGEHALARTSDDEWVERRRRVHRRRSTLSIVPGDLHSH